MRKSRLQEPEEEQNQNVWEPQSDDRCLVCGRETNGKAICTDPNCAAELAMG